MTAEQLAITVEEPPQEAKEQIEEVIKEVEAEVPKIEKKTPKDWIPKTELGRDVVNGKYTDIYQILKKGIVILEPEIVDYLVPELKEEVIYIGGSPGKGGGVKRTATKTTTRMHKSGRRYTMSAMIVVGDEKGIIGIGKEASAEPRKALEKALYQAKLGIMPIKKGCGSWECGCSGDHSIPFTVEGKYGSVSVVLKPAPKGLGLAAHDEAKKILRLAGIKDVWVKTFGQTSTRNNMSYAVIEALKKLSTTKGDI